MALLDFLKNKKEKDQAKEKKAALVLPQPKSEKTAEISAEKNGSKNSVKKFSYIIFKEPHISEKCSFLGEANKYVFKVYSNANKPEIEKAVEGVYGVDVTAVNIITIPHKKRRLGRTEGFKKGFRKAVVTIKKGQKIEIY